MDYNYDVHRLVRIKSDVELPLPEYFRIDDAENLDITFREEDLDFERPEECDIMRIGSYHWLNEDGSLCFEHPGGAKLELGLSDTAGAKVRFNSRFIKLSSKPALESLTMRLLQMSLINREYVMVHAGCVAFDDCGSLIIAPPDFGKTSTVLSLVASGAAFLGDDHVLVDEGAEALCYPRGLTISPHTITSGMVKQVSSWKRVLARFGPLYAAVLRLFGSQAEFRRISEELIKDRATIDHAFILKGFAPNPRLELIDGKKEKENMIESMVLPMPYMTGYPDSYVDLYLYLRDAGLRTLIERSIEVLREAMEGVKCYEVKGPSIKSWPQAIRERLG